MDVDLACLSVLVICSLQKGCAIFAQIRTQVFCRCSLCLGYDTKVLLHFYEHDDIKCLNQRGRNFKTLL